MGIKPTITKGLGALTPEVWSRMVDTIAWVEANKGAVMNTLAATARIKTNITTPDQGYILAKITSAEDLNGAGNACFQWKYGWLKQGVGGGASAVAATDSGVTEDASTETTWAMNLCELGNTAVLRNGYPHVSDHITNSDGFRIAKVPVGTIVQMFSTRHTATSTRLQWFFNYPNPTIGECPE